MTTALVCLRTFVIFPLPAENLCIHHHRDIINVSIVLVHHRESSDELELPFGCRRKFATVESCADTLTCCLLSAGSNLSCDRMAG